jgi:acetate kinase
MGTRSGDMDPAVPLHLMNTLGLSAKDMDTILNKKSGLLGVCGHNDLRAIIDSKVSGAFMVECNTVSNHLYVNEELWFM